MENKIKDIIESAFEEIQDLINNDFNENLAPHIVKAYGTNDQSAIDEAYNNYTDMLCKDNVIPEWVCNELTHDDYTESEWRGLLKEALNL